MKKILIAGVILSSLLARAQEFSTDLFAALNQSSLSLFMKSSYTVMDVVTKRTSSQYGMVEEYSTTYRKGKINPERINFTTTYTEHYILDDRKKSMGRYDLGPNYDIFRYERSDFNSRNMRTFTYYHYFILKNNVVSLERIRTKEYITSGSAEQDSVVTKDSVMYDLQIESGLIKQKDLSSGGGTTTYYIEQNKLVKVTVSLTGFSEEDLYSYDAKGQLISIETNLIGEDGQKIRTVTKLYYNLEGLITQVSFEDQSGAILEQKYFTYK